MPSFIWNRAIRPPQVVHRPPTPIPELVEEIILPEIVEEIVVSEPEPIVAVSEPEPIVVEDNATEELAEKEEEETTD